MNGNWQRIESHIIHTSIPGRHHNNKEWETHDRYCYCSLWTYPITFLCTHSDFPVAVVFISFRPSFRIVRKSLQSRSRYFHSVCLLSVSRHGSISLHSGLYAATDTLQGILRLYESPSTVASLFRFSCSKSQYIITTLF